MLGCRCDFEYGSALYAVVIGHLGYGHPLGSRGKNRAAHNERGSRLVRPSWRRVVRRSTKLVSSCQLSDPRLHIY